MLNWCLINMGAYFGRSFPISEKDTLGFLLVVSGVLWSVSDTKLFFWAGPLMRKCDTIPLSHEVLLVRCLLLRFASFHIHERVVEMTNLRICGTTTKVHLHIFHFPKKI